MFYNIAVDGDGSRIWLSISWATAFTVAMTDGNDD